MVVLENVDYGTLKKQEMKDFFEELKPLGFDFKSWGSSLLSLAYAHSLLQPPT